MTTEAGFLRIYVYGASEGESIALHFPNNAWGVVDSLASSPRDPGTNPVHRLLKDKKVSEIEFLCITHPHADHFMGMTQFFRDFRVKQFWTFFGLEPTDFKLLRTYFLAEAAQANRARLKEAAQELTSIFDAAESSGIEPQLVMSLRRLHPVPRDDALRFEVWGIAPTDKSVRRYKRNLLNSFTRNPVAVQALPHAKHNEISIGLRINFGKTMILLGGDVEEEGWQEVLKQHGQDELAAHFVKVSHHGSSTGYCSCLWPALCGKTKRKPIAALTPYKRFGLPDPEALDHISQYVEAVYSASTTGHAKRTEDWRIKAIGKLKAAQTGRIQGRSSAPGCCEIEANDQGDCRVILHSPACTLFRAKVSEQEGGS